MSKKRRILIAAVLLGGAVCAALPFARSPLPTKTTQQAAGGEPLLLRGVDTKSDAYVPNPTDAEGNSASAALAVAAETSDSATAPAVSHLPSLGNLSPPPELASDYPGEFETDQRPSDSSAALVARAPGANDDGNTTTAPSAARRRHTIRDGDTLESLAARYLGERKRADEIYGANRSLLPQRDVLPIGVEIVIPDQSAKP